MLSGSAINYGRLYSKARRSTKSYSTGVTTVAGQDVVTTRDIVYDGFEFDASSFQRLADVPIEYSGERVAVAKLSKADSGILFETDWLPPKNLGSFKVDFDVIASLPTSNKYPLTFKVMQARITGIRFFNHEHFESVRSLRVDGQPWYRYADEVWSASPDLRTVNETLLRIERLLQQQQPFGGKEVR